MSPVCEFIGKTRISAFFTNFQSDKRVFSRRFRRKSRTLTVTSFFFVSSTRSVHFFSSFVQFFGQEVNPDFLGSEKQESVGSSLALNHKIFMLPKVKGRPKGPPFAVISALCDPFSETLEAFLNLLG